MTEDTKLTATFNVAAKPAWSAPLIEVLSVAETQNSGLAAPDPSIAQAIS